MDEYYQIACAGDFNLLFNSELDADSGTQFSKANLLVNFFEIKQTLDLCGTWRVRDSDNKRFPSRQKHFRGLIQRRLDYIFIAESLSVVRTEILGSSLVTTHRCELK